ncbi:hypothetical protein MRB53_018411 [Persea americana]|uniref:Uncharacterized protein n=1 Tax=Persea americana TaxID=3435 RepID=A0ACC2M989_PERAE|nr:hypothetical protein MRB53_018411 [Persea americana]
MATDLNPFVSSSQASKIHFFFNISFLFLLFTYVTIYVQAPNSHLHHHPTKPFTNTPQSLHDSKEGCIDLQRYHDNKARCAYVRSERQCQSEGYIDYLQLFYCTFGQFVVLGYMILVLWLVLLFYLLGDTTAYYFCSSLESLSNVLKLSPTIAGITLLSLGNGAPDVFSSIVSFNGAGAGDVGLNSVLGGTFFVTSVVVGIISILVSPRQISIDKLSFITDACFFLLALSSLLVILIIGRISIWIALSFTSLYFVYVFIVSTTHTYRKTQTEPLLLISRGFYSHESTESGELDAPLLVSINSEETDSAEKEALEASNQTHQTDKTSCFNFNSSASYCFSRFLYLLELPIYLPRRLTIPVVSEERWSKPFAVISVTLAPVLLAAFWNSQKGDMGSRSSLITYIIGGSIGSFLGVIAFVTTERFSPPRRFLFLWLAVGFLMSVIWTYMIAEELVALLISLGTIFGISPSILGLTVLAWGNSLGDLIANVTMATKGGSDGAQIAISGCYAGPIFNTLVGLGLSLVLSSWHVHPSSYAVPKDPSLFQTLGFLVGGVLWALVILPRNDMKLNKVLGVGVLAIYLCFLSLRLAQTLGLVKLQGYLD